MNGESGEKKTKIYNTLATGIKILRIVIFLTKFSDMSNLFDVANKNVRSVVEKNKQSLWVIAKTREGYHINQGVDKSVFFSSYSGRGMKKGSVFMEMQ